MQQIHVMLSALPLRSTELLNHVHSLVLRAKRKLYQNARTKGACLDTSNLHVCNTLGGTFLGVTFFVLQILFYFIAWNI
jgi:hypothetical protein